MSGGEELNAARAYLRAGDASSVHAHLQALLLRIVKEKPTDPLRHFEALSVHIKQERMREQQRDSAANGSKVNATGVLGVDQPNAPLVSTPAAEAALAAYLQRTQDLIKKPKKFNEEGEEEEEDEPEHNPISPDLQQEAYLLQQAGQQPCSRCHFQPRECQLMCRCSSTTALLLCVAS